MVWGWNLSNNCVNVRFIIKSSQRQNWYIILYPAFYSDLVYKLRRVKGEANFISSGSKIVKHLPRRQYDPAIIERTLGLVLDPFTALYRSFLKSCTLTNKAVGTIWRALSKPVHAEATGSWSPSPLIVIRDSFSFWTWAYIQTARSTAYFNWGYWIFMIFYPVFYY